MTKTLWQGICHRKLVGRVRVVMREKVQVWTKKRGRMGEWENGRGGESVVIEIADTGVGITADDLQKVMEPFFTTKIEGKGTGLGLPICRRIAQEHHGTFDITSEVGKGTTVRVVLPVISRTNGAFLRET